MSPWTSSLSYFRFTFHEYGVKRETREPVCSSLRDASRDSGAGEEPAKGGTTMRRGGSVFALAEPLGFVAAGAVAGVVGHAGGDGLGIGGGAVLEDEPLAFGDDGEGEAFFILFHGEAGGFVAVAGAGGELLLVQGDGFHVLVEEGDVELAFFDGDLAVHGFVFAEFEDAAAVGAEFDAFMGEGQGGDEAEEGDESGFSF
jgi:hypothetical protein